MAASVQAQSVYPGQFAGKIKARTLPSEALCFDLSEVRLLPSRLRDNLERDSAWMVNISAERLLHSFYNNAGVWAGREGGYMTVKKYGGWESLDCELRGHVTGHYLSACGLMYTATGDTVFKQKADSIVDGLAKVQQALGNGYVSAFPEELINRNIRTEAVWAPWYTLHKILAGLIDAYLYTNNETALDIAVKMGNWAHNKLQGIDDETRRKMLRNEFGGINEAFYNLYAITADEKYRDLAEFFYHNEVIDPLKNEEPDFGTKHTNTFIPKVLGEIRKYELGIDGQGRTESEFFFNEMLHHHTFAPGCLSDKEHFFPVDKFSEHISGYTGETCCTYNMLKLARHLFCAHPQGEIMDYYERALYNHILGQQDTSTGMLCYFLPLASGTHKVYSTPENSFWCCVGSGFESQAKFAESIYFHSGDDNAVYVNLFIPSELTWKAKRMKLTQLTDFPSSPVTTLNISVENKVKALIKLRNPGWSDKLTVKVNGKKVNAKAVDGYVGIERVWRDGDRIEVELDMSLAVDKAPGCENTAALIYGPVVLAGKLGTDGMIPPAPDSNPLLYNDYYTYNYNIPEGLPTKLDVSTLRKVAPLKWVTGEGVCLEPLYDIHRERYAVYWDVEK